MNEVAIFDDKQLQTIKEMYCKNLNQEEIAIFMHICQRTKLDPFARQIYAVKRNDKKLGKEVMTIQTGIDGYRLIAERTSRYSPGREPTFQYNSTGNLVSSTAYVKKMTADGTWHEVAATAYWQEYYQHYDGKPSAFWAKMPHGQLSKCAEALALRKAFPGDLSGVYTKEEMEQSEAEMEPSEVEVRHCEPAKPQVESIAFQGLPADLISKDQVDAIVVLIKQADSGYVTKLEKYLLEDLKYASYGNIEKKDYQKIVNGLQKNIEMTMKKG